MTQKPPASPPGDPAPVPDSSPVREPVDGENPSDVHTRPSEAATADIEERQDTERAERKKEGRPPADAPSY